MCLALIVNELLVSHCCIRIAAHCPAVSLYLKLFRTHESAVSILFTVPTRWVSACTLFLLLRPRTFLLRKLTVLSVRSATTKRFLVADRATSSGHGYPDY